MPLSVNLKLLGLVSVRIMATRKINDFAGFKEVLNNSKNIVVLTGAGVSAESGIPVFRGAGGVWNSYRACDLASLGAFRRNPSLVWEFYHYRRTVAFNAQPNKAHIALAKFEEDCIKDGRQFHLITQNVDGLHFRAGSKNVIELHGALNKVRCTNNDCKAIEENNDNPICEALKDRGDPRSRENLPDIDIADLPKCKSCNTIVRPHIVWFGENLDKEVLNKAMELVEKCDLCLVIGTSMTIFPAAQFAPRVAEREQPVAEFNINEEPKYDFTFHFPGQSTLTLPKALGYDDL